MKIYLKLLLVFCCFGGLLKAGEYDSVLLPRVDQRGHKNCIQVVDSDDYAFVFREENKFFSINWEGDIELVSAFPFEYYELSLKGAAAQGGSLVLTGDYCEAGGDYFQPWVSQEGSFEKLCSGDYLFAKSCSVNSEGTVLGIGVIDARRNLAQLISWIDGELRVVSDEIIPAWIETPGWITEMDCMVAGAGGYSWTTSPALSLPDYLLEGTSGSALVLDHNYRAEFAIKDLVAISTVRQGKILGIGIFNFSAYSFIRLKAEAFQEFERLSGQHIAMNAHGDVVCVQLLMPPMASEKIYIWRCIDDEGWEEPDELPLFNLNVWDELGLYPHLVCLNIHRDGRILLMSRKNFILLIPREN